MDVRGVAAPVGRPPRWLIPLVLLGVLVTGTFLVVLFWWAGTTPVGDPRATGESPGEPPQAPSVAGGGAVCDVGEPHFRGSEAKDGLLHGGGLGMPTPHGLHFGDPARMPYAFDVALTQSLDEETWAGLGAVRIEDPYSTPEQASSTVTACLAQEYASSRLEVVDARFVQIPGATQAHERTGFLSQEGTSREFRVLIADTASPESLAVYVRVSAPGTPAAGALAEVEAQLAKS